MKRLLALLLVPVLSQATVICDTVNAPYLVKLEGDSITWMERGKPTEHYNVAAHLNNIASSYAEGTAVMVHHIDGHATGVSRTVIEDGIIKSNVHFDCWD
ncbi:hypothetical protein NVP1152O_086 [Vibrio phage 1.152.O._10N.222.46.E1]|uniref:Uncharacterized protein n=5 Tax=Nahantvirus 49C7 TaxID=2846601 RepID=A0A2I7RBI9_9CAUD|nr:hypothetical protein HYP57_gp100 [Vibrio phage 1.026.O._10N.222.49.C7]AUR82568.1 hypothetical protein NVP1025O_085 [Vibrio phage 1.025.O._10N.222.46.B6]AUR90818.1 hypothetical protein NVP1150O_085 [Vibrio phage 1.150.O._10N.222.46.A6]AUR90991.1 hypothetical protein NVP1152O_086 [Vibrio phage 1.152.O._10N.222.46.E1]AUS02459.1 hypothetical protein NVP2130O_085 [Vibrio phage 2.130.O._10N.222.46.C2]AUR82676.1 hypothetical protein NVP1026O_085 [Vibrio phage 1.026.O._10N.222.49.C7]